MSPWRSLDEVVGPSRTGWASYCQFNLALRVHIPGSSLEYSHLNEFWTTLWGWAGRTWRHYQTSGVFRDRVEAQRLCVYRTYCSRFVELLLVCALPRFCIVRVEQWLIRGVIVMGDWMGVLRRLKSWTMEILYLVQLCSFQFKFQSRKVLFQRFLVSS